MTSKETFAVVKSGGKQYKASAGQKILVNKINAKAGDKITLSEVLAVGDAEGIKSLGTPLVSGASVAATVIGDIKEKKVITFKKKRHHGYTKKQGHRQVLTEILIDDVKA